MDDAMTINETGDVRQVFEHELKTWPAYFDAISFSGKRFEVRRDDRDFQTGDTVRLHEWDAAKGYSGRQLKFRIGYVLRGFLPEHVVFALESLTAQPFEMEPKSWRCFHCDEVFTSEAEARDHFGVDAAFHSGRSRQRASKS
jgi:hypothetical protein